LTSKIALSELAKIVHPFKGSQKIMVMWTVHSDLSYDGSPPGNTKGSRHEPRTYVVSGILARPEYWAAIEEKWDAANKEFGVPRFHGAHLNGRTNEYEGWLPQRAKEYSTKLLKVLKDCGSPIMFVCGLHADHFTQMLSETSRRKLGTPYQVCFNSCMALIASYMDESKFSTADRFSVLVDKDDGYEIVVRSFLDMKENATFASRFRLGTSTPAAMEEVIALQTADLVAYEWFKWFNTRGRKEGDIRPILVPKRIFLSCETESRPNRQQMANS
jgi:hypothetical protein